MQAGEEDVLYTREVPPDADVSYGANACHTISLRYSESLEDHLQAFAEPEFPSEPTLVFEVCGVTHVDPDMDDMPWRYRSQINLSPLFCQVWNKWPSGEVSQVGEARLPLVQLLRNAASNEVEYRLPVELEGDTAEASRDFSSTALVQPTWQTEIEICGIQIRSHSQERDEGTECQVVGLWRVNITRTPLYYHM